MKNITIGLTGGIGSGKSFISRIFQTMDIPVYDSDANAKRLMIDDSAVVEKVKRLLGESAYHKGGRLNRKHIAGIIFKDPTKRDQLNDIVHPAVRKDFKRFVKRNEVSKLVINEAALFVENGSYKDFDFLISVVAPENLRIARVSLRDSSNEGAVKSRMKAQSSDKEKIKVSHFVIYNDATDNLFRQISKIHAELITFVKKEKQ